MTENWTIITGASSGIGKECVKHFSKNGYKIIASSRSIEKKNLKNIIQIPWDLSNLDSLNDYITTVFSEIKKQAKEKIVINLLDIAGIDLTLPATMITKNRLEKIFTINTFSKFMLASLLLRTKKTREQSSIVIIGSLSAHEKADGKSIYAASKGALETFVKSSSSEFIKKNIRVNLIAPGIINTAMTEKTKLLLTEKQFSNLTASYPMGIGEPSDIANLAEFLISKKAKWITGKTFLIDGGTI
ncbi:MAG: SDR family oxidoreductase [Clostridiales Family XIII bacterium]|jgi:NAD(P)-dependent dehydrogenase (short-subunit alcohol dehydrogenase family)|nr:SDR family oxidoreductase [Clostridiales Family XIII bacterium]